MKMKRNSILLLSLCMGVACALAFNSAARADEIIYGNNASYGPDTVSQIDITTGTVTANIDVSPGNGRGVVQVGNILYTTTASSNIVYKYNLTTSTSSTAFTVSGSSGLSTISYDGTNFWIGDYSGTNNVYEYSPTGTLLKTISLSQCTGYCDGVGYLAANGGEIISNEFDGYYANSQYDIYDLNGTLKQSDFINSASGCTGSAGSTGLAFDGTDYFVSCINDSALAEYSGAGAFIKDIAFTGDNSNAGAQVEGISANYAEVLNPSPVPEPWTLFMVGTGLAAMVAEMRRRLAHQS
ncbi:MAG TPA: hypothetical protein VND90_00645 [Terracidiphilus sp.]|nr:hypothetical protein [Terracidiphilus sp.]